MKTIGLSCVTLNYFLIYLLNDNANVLVRSYSLILHLVATRACFMHKLTRVIVLPCSPVGFTTNFANRIARVMSLCFDNFIHHNMW